jgi:hypothetical protein
MPGPPVTGDIDYKGAPYARVLFYATLTVTRDDTAVQVNVLTTPIPGLVNPVDVLAAPATRVRNLQFKTGQAAGEYMYTIAIGRFVAVLVRLGEQPVSIPRFSGEWSPFTITAISVAGVVSVSMLAGNTIPFIPRQITGDANVDGRLLTMIATITRGNTIMAYASREAQLAVTSADTAVPYYLPV